MRDDDRVGGHLEIASLARHLVFTNVVETDELTEVAQTARIRLSGEAFGPDAREEWLVPGRALKLLNDDGPDWLFVVQTKTGMDTTLERTDTGDIVAQRQSRDRADAQSISLLVAPLHGLSEGEVNMLVHPDSAVQVDYTLLNLDGEDVRNAAAAWDETLGAYRVNLGSLSESGIINSRNYDAHPELHNWYGRHRITVDTSGVGPIAVPMAFYSNQSIGLNITGGVALWRDAQGAPIGVPIQMSKNWHDPSGPMVSPVQPAGLLRH